MMLKRWASGRRTRIAAWLTISVLCMVVAGLTMLRSPRERLLERSAEVLGDVPPGFGLYVDEALCAECHPNQAASYAKTAHARTLQPASQWPLAPALGRMTFKDPERGATFHYRFDPKEGLSVTVPERLGKDAFPLDLAFGSGRHRVTLLTLIGSRAGGTSGIEHRVSASGDQKGLVLSLTPGHLGHAPTQDVEQFGRVANFAALVRCLDCHSTRGEIRDQEIRGLVPNVGCQKCHWPGREHVIAMRHAAARGMTAPTRPKPSATEEIRACSRCHPQSGSDDELRSLPNHVQSVRVQASELTQSRCFIQSENRLGCSTCHDPHAPIASDPEPYVQRCLTCHGTSNSVACPVSPTKDCVRCHMPPLATDKGKWHDHRIRKKPDAGS